MAALAAFGGGECAICFEDVGDLLALPCACAVAYCGACWDRALAASFKAGGRARCPSCRSGIRVDFDPSLRCGRGALVFGTEVIDAGADAAAPVDGEDAWDAREAAIEAHIEETVNRIAAQAAPLMARHLREYGEAHRSLRPAFADAPAALGGRSVDFLVRLHESLGVCSRDDDDAAKLLIAGAMEAYVPLGDGSYDDEAAEALIASAREAADSPEALAAAVARLDDADAPPAAPLLCVCGAALVATDGLYRYRCHVREERPDLPAADAETAARFMQAIDVARGSSTIVCDVCDAQVAPTASVLTCAETGERTILHATEYDVCEKCFFAHAIRGAGDERLPAERRVYGAEDDLLRELAAADDDDDDGDDDGDGDGDDDDDDGDDDSEAERAWEQAGREGNQARFSTILRTMLETERGMDLSDLPLPGAFSAALADEFADAAPPPREEEGP